MSDDRQTPPYAPPRYTVFAVTSPRINDNGSCSYLKPNHSLADQIHWRLRPVVPVRGAAHHRVTFDCVDASTKLGRASFPCDVSARARVGAKVRR